MMRSSTDPLASTSAVPLEGLATPQPGAATLRAREASADGLATKARQIALDQDATYDVLRRRDLVALGGTNRALRDEVNTLACWRRSLAATVHGTAAQLGDTPELRRFEDLKRLIDFAERPNGWAAANANLSFSANSLPQENLRRLLAAWRAAQQAERLASARAFDRLFERRHSAQHDVHCCSFMLLLMVGCGVLVGCLYKKHPHAMRYLSPYPAAGGLFAAVCIYVEARSWARCERELDRMRRDNPGDSLHLSEFYCTSSPQQVG